MVTAAYLLVAWSFGIGQSIDSDCYPITATDLRRPDAPAFGDFKVEVLSPVRPAPVDLKSHPLARRYRTILRAAARKGPNFAGHYTVVTWGCGSSCVQFAVIDARNGAVFFARDFESVSGVRVKSDGFEPDAAHDGNGRLRYRLDSRLLIVLGALNERAEREGATYFAFEEGTFRQIATTYLTKRRCQDIGDGRPFNTRLHLP